MPQYSAGYREAERRIRAAAERGEKRLNLRYLRAGSIPPSLGMLTGLRDLDLAANDLTELPDFLVNLRDLEALNVALNSLRNLPAAFATLRKLQFLDLARNQYSSVPEPVLGLSNLAVLNVSHNRIGELPIGLAHLKKLQVLPQQDRGPYDPQPRIHGGAGFPEVRPDFLGAARPQCQKAEYSVDVPPRLFLSYARADRDRVRSLYDQLSSSGFVPWMDAQDILGGERWADAVESAIRDCDFFLFCLSRQSLGRRGFLQREVRLGLDRQTGFLERDIYFVPVRLDDCALPAEIARFQALDLFEPDGYSRLVTALHKGMARRAR